jgi:HK97 family phage portal protein
LPNLVQRAWNALFRTPPAVPGTGRAGESRSNANAVGLTDTDAFFRLFNPNYVAGAVNVTEVSSLGLSAVYGCVRVLSESIASLPWGVYEYTDRGSKLAIKHPNFRLLRSEPHTWYTSFSFRKTLMTHVLLWGNGYARIIRDGRARPTAFQLYYPWQVNVLSYPDSFGEQQLYYTTPDGTFSADDMIHVAGLGFNGVVGRSVIGMQAEALGVGLAAQRFGSNFFRNGAHLTGALKHPKTLKTEAHKNLKESFREKYMGMDNAGEVIVLEEGMDFIPFGVPPDDAQFIETRKFSRSDVCAMFRVPPHMIADLERATFSNIEQQDLGFVKHSLMPWMVLIEQEFDRKIFYESEKDRYFNKLNANGMLRGDVATRKEYYKDGIQNGWLSQNDVRELEDMLTIEGGDRYFIQQNMMPLDKVDEVLANQKQAPPAKDNGKPGTGSKNAA